jgi:hypothetical protein
MKKKLLSLVVLFIVTIQLVSAQCAMCKASAETSVEAGASEAAGINTGVLYMLMITFGMLTFIAYLLYKGHKATRKLEE